MKNRLWGLFITISQSLEWPRNRLVSLLFAAAIVSSTAPALASASIAFDTSAVTSSTNPSVSITRGTSGSNYIGLVFLQNGNTNTESGCTWGGTAMTQIVDVNDASLSHNAWYYIVAPPSGAQTVSCTTSGNFAMGVATYSGVDQSTPFDTLKYGQQYATSSGTVTNGNTLSVTGTTIADNDWTVLGANYGCCGAPVGSTTVRVDLPNASPPVPIIMDSNGAITPAGSTSMTIQNNSGVTEGIAEIMIALKPAVTPIAFDNATSATAVGTSSATLSFATAGSNRILIVSLTNDNGAGSPSVTYNGVALRQAIDFEASAVWYLINPPTGTHDIVITSTTSNAFIVMATSLDNVDQTTGIGAIATSSDDNNVTSSSITVATTRANSWIVDATRINGDRSGVTATGSGQTIRDEGAITTPPNIERGEQSTMTTGATGNYTPGYSWSGGGIDYLASAVEVLPAN